jgi:hypothetical protein
MNLPPMNLPPMNLPPMNLGCNSASISLVRFFSLHRDPPVLGSVSGMRKSPHPPSVGCTSSENDSSGSDERGESLPELGGVSRVRKSPHPLSVGCPSCEDDGGLDVLGCMLCGGVKTVLAIYPSIVLTFIHISRYVAGGPDCEMTSNIYSIFPISHFRCFQIPTQQSVLASEK